MRVSQSGFDRQAFGRRLDDALAAELAHQRRLWNGMRELGRIGIKVQDAARQGVVFKPQRWPQVFQAGATIERQGQDGPDIGAGTRSRAFAQEAQPPRPLGGIGAQAPQ